MERILLIRLLFAICLASADVSTPHQCMPAPSQKCFTVIVDQKLNWNDAEKYCEKNLPNGRLAAIHNAFAGSIISGWLPFLTTDPWIGAFQIGSLPYQWTDGTSLDYTNWTPGEPTGPCGQICYTLETNAGITCQQGKWRTADCANATSQFICEYGNYTNPSTTASPATTSSPPTIAERSCNSEDGKCFSLVIGALEWTDAENFCRNELQNSDMATLASINSQEDANIIATFLQYPTLNSNVWIGGFAFGDLQFQWSDKSRFSFTNWAPGQPPHNADGCVQVCLKTDTTCVKGQWTVVSCQTAQSFVCETIRPTDCLDWQIQRPHLPSGIYTLTPPGAAPFQAYCDMETDGGGWTVIQRRVDGSLSFYDKTWNQYKSGFNNGLDKNLWLGNEYIHILSTKDAYVDLRIDIWGDRTPGSQYANSYWWQKQSSFYIDSETFFYTLHVNRTLEGNASISGDVHGINYNIETPFSTNDSNHDNCNHCCTHPGFDFGGWWLNYCTWSSLNGKYIPAAWDAFSGFVWHTGISFVNPVQSRMMIRKAIN